MVYQAIIIIHVIFSLYIIVCTMPRDCKAWRELGITRNGLYPIKPNDEETLTVIL